MEIDPLIVHLIEECLQISPTHRPSADDIVKKLVLYKTENEHKNDPEDFISIKDMESRFYGFYSS